jgi:aminopeptidase N
MTTMGAMQRWRGRTAAGLLVLAAVAALATASAVTTVSIDGQPVPAAVTEGSPGAEGAGDAYYPTDGNGGYDVAHYAVSIGYQPQDRRLDGDTTITARATQALSRFNLDLFRLDVRSVEVDGRTAEFDHDGDELVITPAAVIGDGATFEVRVRYDGKPERFGESGLGAGGWYANSSGTAVAAGEPHSAPAWYPANDTPRDKATFALDARVPDGWTVISNGVDEPPASADGWTTYRWRLDEPVATYLTTVAIGRWRVVRSQLSDGTPVIDAYAPGAGSAEAEADERRLPEVVDFLSSKFGPYPFEAAGGIFLDASIGYALETQTRPVYSPRPGLEIIVHETAHQWFGNSVSLRNWADICLNECLASYAQWLWREAKNGADLDQEYRDAVGRLDFGRRLYDMGAGNEFRGVYTKGAVAMHALRRQLGDETFDAVLKGWTERHEDGNASWPQFEDHVEEVSGQRLDGFFDAWFRGETRPSDEYLWPGPLNP